MHQDDLSNTFGEFGDVVSIDLIPPRGCAFIVMLRRQDAARCLAKLKGHILHGKAITVRNILIMRDSFLIYFILACLGSR